MALIRKTQMMRDLCDWATLREEAARLLQAELQMELMRRKAGHAPEGTYQIVRAEAAHRREVGQPDCVREVVSHEFNRSPNWTVATMMPQSIDPLAVTLE